MIGEAVTDARLSCASAGIDPAGSFEITSMTLSDAVIERSRKYENLSEQELAAAGWQRCFAVEEPRLSESVETYEDIGLEVIALPVRATDSACGAGTGCANCLVAEPGRFRVIYTKPARGGARCS
jgi:hypothetical protein